MLLLLLIRRLAYYQLFCYCLVVGRTWRMDNSLLDNFRLLSKTARKLLDILLRDHLTPLATRLTRLSNLLLGQRSLYHYGLLLLLNLTRLLSRELLQRLLADLQLVLLLWLPKLHLLQLLLRLLLLLHTRRWALIDCYLSNNLLLLNLLRSVGSFHASGKI